MSNEELFIKVAKLAGKYRFWEDLMWDENLEVGVNVSDLFYWACSDAEDITEENFPILVQAIEDVAAISEGAVDRYGPVLFAARARGMRPQGKYISDYVYEYPRAVKVYYEEFGRDVWETPRDENGKIYHDPSMTQALKDLFLALPERPVDLGNPYSPEGSYDYKSE